jgi:hypothetical protein
MAELETVVLEGIQTVAADDQRGDCTHVEKLWKRRCYGKWYRRNIHHSNESNESSVSEEDAISAGSENETNVATV